MNFKKSMLPIILIALIVIFSIINQIQTNKQAKDDKFSSNVTVGDTVKVSNIDTSYILYRIEDKTDYFALKDLNYYLMKFFKSINNNNYENIELNHKYVQFFNLSDEYLKNKYGDYDVLYYDINTINKTKDTFFIGINYREENSDKKIQKVFSLKGNQIIDEPFKYVEDVNYSVNNTDFKASISTKAVFDEYDVYKITIENKTETSLNIGHDMYGFYAISKNNKYYHNLVGENKPIYEILPGETKTYYVRFDVNNPEEIHINIENIDYILEKHFE